METLQLCISPQICQANDSLGAQVPSQWTMPHAYVQQQNSFPPSIAMETLHGYNLLFAYVASYFAISAFHISSASVMYIYTSRRQLERMLRMHSHKQIIAWTCSTHLCGEGGREGREQERETSFWLANPPCRVGEDTHIIFSYSLST